jgi:hypothetical protein
MSSSNLNTLLKQQIKDAVAAIYDEQGTQAANRYSNPEQLSKALLDLLFPEEKAHNTEVTGVVRVPTVNDEAKASDSESTDSKKERKKRGPMSDEAKAAMKAKREATIAAKAAAAAAPAPAEAAPASPKAEEAKPEPEAPGAPKKERKPRGPMSDEAKAAMKAKREATIAAKKAAAE